MKRKHPIYGNCKVLAPDGELMFRCLEKRAYWYLDRNLADIVDNDPLTIKLNFEPNGRGEKSKHLKSIRENKCVVCGEEDIEVLTKHHLIPYEYRRYFAEEQKSHNSCYVVPICMKCHEEYEHDYAVVFKKQIADKYDAPKNGKTIERHNAEKHILALLKYRSVMPTERIKELKDLLMEAMENAGLKVTRKDLDSVETLKNYLEFFKSNDQTVDNRHGKIVVDKCKDLDAFSTDWVKHFVDSMNPKHMPEFINELYTSA